MKKLFTPLEITAPPLESLWVATTGISNGVYYSTVWSEMKDKLDF
jgi:hypothetical protein